METMSTPAERLSAVIASPENRYAAMIDLAVALEAEGMFQRDMFVLFNRELTAADAAEDDVLGDELRGAIDRVTGWCEPKDKIFRAEGV